MYVILEMWALLKFKRLSKDDIDFLFPGENFKKSIMWKLLKPKSLYLLEMWTLMKEWLSINVNVWFWHSAKVAHIDIALIYGNIVSQQIQGSLKSNGI